METDGWMDRMGGGYRMRGGSLRWWKMGECIRRRKSLESGLEKIG